MPDAVIIAVIAVWYSLLAAVAIWSVYFTIKVAAHVGAWPF